MKKLVSALLCALMLAMPLLAGEITVSAKSNIEGRGKDEKEAARNSAIAKAERKAVEEGIALFLKDQAPNPKFGAIKEEILNNAGDYIDDKVIVKDVVSSDKTLHLITLEANVNVNKIAAQFKEAVSQAKSDMGTPSISFVLTTYEKKGTKHSASESGTRSIEEKAYLDQKGNASASYEGSESSYSTTAHAGESTKTGKSSVKGTKNSTTDSQTSEDSTGSKTNSSTGYTDNSERTDTYQTSGVSESGTEGTVSGERSAEYSSHQEQTAGVTQTMNSEYSSQSFDERLWKKQPDATVIDAFQQEFKEKNFDLMATDKARNIALAPSNVQLNVNPQDREAVRKAAEKEGANYVARGEVMIIDVAKSSNGNKATVKLGVEIVDVNSGDIVGSYSNTGSAINSSADEAIAQAIKKVSVLGARTLADQTLTTWAERAKSGKQFTVVLKNFTSARSQQRPFMLAVKEAAASVTSTTSPDQTTMIMKVTFKGSKDDLGWAILDLVASKPGFEEAVFDGPQFDGGTLTFKFK